MPALGLIIGIPNTGAGMIPPPGYVFLLDDAGFYILTDDGYYMVVPE